MPEALNVARPRDLFIGGEWTAPDGDGRFEVLNCSTGKVAATIAAAGPGDMERAVAAARRAFDQGPWPRMTHAERAGYLRALAIELGARADDFARIWSTESGIVNRLARARIGPLLTGAFGYYAGLADSFPFHERHRSAGGTEALLVREPVGVVAAIIPWNGPAGLMAYKCAPALIAGCTLIVKSSPEAPCSAYILAEACAKIGLPPGVVNVVTADREVSELLVRHPGVDKVTFTGSTGAGRRIAAICGDRLARCTLELGGKSPAVILDDYDVETAARTIGAGVGYVTGQVCHSLTRIIVTAGRHDAMVDALSATVGAMTVGDAFDPAVEVGPLANAAQLGRVEGYIAAGRREGAVLAAGGRRPAHLDHGFFIEPTVFGHVDNRSTIGREEIFGPVLSVIAARDEDHAIELANDTPYGLNASLFTDDLDRFHALARNIRAGTVGHNASRTDFSIAFGGVKQSGIGREGGVEGLLPFLEPKTMVSAVPWREEAG